MRAIALWITLAGLLVSLPALANDISVGDVRLRSAEDGLVLDADFPCPSDIRAGLPGGGPGEH